jgi:hypothetical protein
MVGNLFDGGTVQFNDVTVPTAGTYSLKLTYATDDERTGYLSANGGQAELIGFFPVTGGWATPGTYTVLIQLQAGKNTISFASQSGTYDPNLSSITLTPYTAPSYPHRTVP